MKKLLLSILLTTTISTVKILADEKDNDPLYECLKLDMDACSTVINRNSMLSECDQKLEEQDWVEKERLGVSLLPLYLQCKKGKKRSCTKFVKQVKRLKMYKKN